MIPVSNTAGPKQKHHATPQEIYFLRMRPLRCWCHLNDADGHQLKAAAALKHLAKAAPSDPSESVCPVQQA